MSEKPSHDSSDCVAFAAVGPAHGRLAPFVGRFKATVKLWMGPGDPMVSTGVMANEWELGGRFLRQVYAGDPSPGPFPIFEGRGYWGYNTVTNRYEGFWIDNASTFMQNEVGHLDDTGKVWTMIGEMADPQQPDKTMRKKSTITLKDPDRHFVEMFFTAPGGKETKAMEILYERMG